MENELCPKCREPYEATFALAVPTVDGGQRTMTIRRSMCDRCQGEADRIEQGARELAEQAARAIAAHEQMLAVPPHFRSAVVEDPQIANFATRFLDNLETKGLYLTGPVGVGKTHACWGLWNQIAQTNPYVEMVFTRTATLLDRLRPEGDHDRRGLVFQAQTTDLLFLDDLGVTKPSEWVAEQLLEILDERYIAHRPIIATSNLIPAETGRRLDERIASRLAEMVEVVPLTGSDRRRN